MTKSGSILSTTALNAKLLPAKSTIAIPGVYVFGGMTNKGPTNTLSVLSVSYIGNEPTLSINIPKVAGSPPSARFGHSTHFLEGKSLLVIVGGQKHKGDSMEREVDVHVLELIDLRWIRVSIKNTSVLNNMAWHAATEDDDRVYIFGGIDRNNYRGADIVSLEFESGPPLARTRFN